MKLVKTLLAILFTTNLLATVATAQYQLTGDASTWCQWWSGTYRSDIVLGGNSSGGGLEVTGLLNATNLCGPLLDGRTVLVQSRAFGPNTVNIHGSSAVLDGTISINYYGLNNVPGGNQVTITGGAKLTGGLDSRTCDSGNSIVIADSGTLVNGDIGLNNPGDSIVVKDGAVIVSPYFVAITGSNSMADIFGASTAVTAASSIEVDGPNTLCRIRDGAHLEVMNYQLRVMNARVEILGIGTQTKTKTCTISPGSTLNISGGASAILGDFSARGYEGGGGGLGEVACIFEGDQTEVNLGLTTLQNSALLTVSNGATVSVGGTTYINDGWYAPNHSSGISMVGLGTVIDSGTNEIRVGYPSTQQNFVSIGVGANLRCGQLSIGSPTYDNGFPSIGLVSVAGTLFATNASNAGQISIYRGSLVCDCGTITADKLFVGVQTLFSGGQTGSGSFLIPCGTARVSSLIVSNGLPQIIGDGTNVAQLVLGGGTNFFYDGLLINSNSALSGSSFISGTVTNRGTIQAIGSLVFLGPVVNEGNIILAGAGASVQFLGGFSGNPVQLQIVGGSLTNQVVPLGSNVTFSVVASGTPPFSYQWLFENSALAGQTNTSLVLSNLSLANRGGYSVAITDANGSITSSVASLTVLLPPSVVQVAAGRLHSLFLKSDGSFWTMGENSFGQLGDGSYNTTNRPHQVVLAGVSRLAAGDNHSLFLKTNGSLWTVGHGVSGQLGDGANGDRNQPVQILAGGVAAISGGGGFTLLLKSDGSLWGTGDNYFGQLGDGTGSNTNQPRQLLSAGVATMAAGYSHSLVVESNGSLWAAGLNTYGALGNGTFTATNLFEQVVSSGVTAIAAGRFHSLFLKSDGSLWGMGHNSYGQLGDGTYSSTNQPEQIVASGVTAIAAGKFFSLFLKNDGSLWGMGDNASGQLGGGTFSGSNTPRQIVASGVVQIAAGDLHTVFVKSDGSLWGMGDNSSGQLGDGTYSTTNSPKLIVAGPPGFNQFFSQSRVGSDLQMGFAGYVGAKYALDRTFSLSPPDWMPQFTNTTDAGGVVVFTNTPNPAANNFWRVRLVP